MYNIDLQQRGQQAGAEQKKSLSRQKRNPHPIRLGPIRRSSFDLNPCSPIPTKVMMRPGGTIRREGNQIDRHKSHLGGSWTEGRKGLGPLGRGWATWKR